MTPASRAGEILARLEHEGIRLGHERMLALLAALGEPQRRLPAVLVAGTNGKGSVSSLLASIGQVAGYRVGLYTSPHLESPTERIRLEGCDITDDDLAYWLELLLARCAASSLEPPTYFEALTLAALLHFDHHQVDLAVLEVGLGGRLDATNVTEPLLSVITAIGLDHQNVLGDTLTAIAGEKVRVARPRRPLVAWTALPEVSAAIEKGCAEIGARLLRAEKDTRVVPLGQDGLTQRLEIHSRRHTLQVQTRLLGAHQETNLALAVVAAEELADAGYSRIDGAAITKGIEACVWPGRLEWMTAADGRRVLIDAAHNEDGAVALAHYLDGLGEPFDLLFGALGDKSVDRMLPVLARGAERITLTRPPSPRATDPRGWLPLLPERQGGDVVVVDDPAAALAQALARQEGLPRRALVMCGSIYLIGHLRRILRETYGFRSSISG